MFKIEYEYNGHTRTYEFDFKSAWAANLKARELSNRLDINTHVYNLHTGVYVSHYWAN